ncbi:DUF202 domain-containing protein [Salinibacterium sp. ZJ450]|uniref:DUF202 domain-containing protein n=1 Tax=Salinibacterium sp. ZJ450 TaxID=2708338 RepID=UPI00141F0243|nr:DUF202 domain-containing protein [Salinibacterium sp. ZJ450]
MTDEKVFDPGLQPERTLLAWQRTVLSLAVAGVLAARFAAPQIGLPAAVLGLISAALSIAAYVGVRYRYRRAHTGLRAAETLHSLSAWPLAALAGSTFTLGIVAAVYALGVAGE